MDLARAARPFDSKVRALMRLLRRAREPAIVFTEYRDALAHVQARLPAGVDAAVIHGGMDSPARSDAVRSFTSGRAPVLLATDAAAHGLNLQARCRLVVNLDLPWNPVRLEQRIGRVDRIGQRRRVHAIHLVARGTTEDAVLDRLTARTACARRSLGEAPTNTAEDLPEVAIADALFGANARPRTRVATREPGTARAAGLPTDGGDACACVSPRRLLGAGSHRGSPAHPASPTPRARRRDAAARAGAPRRGRPLVDAASTSRRRAVRRDRPLPCRRRERLRPAAGADARRDRCGHRRRRGASVRHPARDDSRRRRSKALASVSPPCSPR